MTEFPSGRALARVAVEDYLGRVFKIERELNELREARERAGDTLSAAELFKRRQEKTAQIFAAFHQWVEDLLPATPSQSALGKALSYTHTQWQKLVLHLKHGEVPVHNNYVKNIIRPFSQGRRVWLFAHNPFGARASANLFSLLATARANGLDPSVYLNHLFEQLPAADTVEALEALLPWNVTVGSACIAERRGIEILDGGQAVTAYMSFGDSVRIEMVDEQGHSLFGAIEQQIVRAMGRPPAPRP